MIEFFVGSNRRGEHYERFNEQTGRYRNFKTNNFQLVNFVFQEPKSIIETYEGLTVVYLNPMDNYTKATLYLFVRHPKAIDDNSDWRQSGHYEINEIQFDNEIYYKTLYLYLFKGTNKLKQEKLEGVPLTVNAFKYKIREIFKTELKDSDTFTLDSFDEIIENDYQYSQLSHKSPVNILISD